MSTPKAPKKIKVNSKTAMRVMCIILVALMIIPLVITAIGSI